MAVTKDEVVTVVTIASDPKSPWPALCQILKGLCYNPLCCVVSQHLRRVQGASQSVLGALQIMIGVITISLTVILHCSTGEPWAIPDFIGLCFGFEGVFIALGVMCILSEKFPSPCLVVVNVILQLLGVGFTIATIVFYSIGTNELYLWRFCEIDHPYWERHRTTPSPSAQEQAMKERCLKGKAVVMMLLRSICAVLIVLSVLELCVVLSSFIMGIKALKSMDKGKNKNTEDPELYKPLLEDLSTDPAA